MYKLQASLPTSGKKDAKIARMFSEETRRTKGKTNRCSTLTKLFYLFCFL
jgi:hypothetical protein